MKIDENIHFVWGCSLIVLVIRTAHTCMFHFPRQQDVNSELKHLQLIATRELGSPCYLTGKHQICVCIWWNHIKHVSVYNRIIIQKTYFNVNSDLPVQYFPILSKIQYDALKYIGKPQTPKTTWEFSIIKRAHHVTVSCTVTVTSRKVRAAMIASEANSERGEISKGTNDSPRIKTCPLIKVQKKNKSVTI